MGNLLKTTNDNIDNTIDKSSYTGAREHQHYTRIRQNCSCLKLGLLLLLQ